MFEDAREKKKRSDPKRSQFRKSEGVERDWGCNQQRGRRVIDVSRTDEGDRASVIDPVRISVQPLM